MVASDPNGDTLSYSITAGNTSGAFAINASTGTLTVANSAALDYETTPQFSLTVRVADPGGLSDTAIISIALNDVAEGNRAPVVNNQGFSLNENSANGTVVGTVAASDPDGNTLSYSITAGNTSSAFAINASTGALTVANSAALDYETLTQFSLTVRVADPGGLSDTATVTVSLINVADTATGAANGKAIFQSKCSGCHTHGRGDHLGPDLKNRGADGFTSQFIADPAGMVVRSTRGRNLLATWGYVMPDYNLTTAQINDILAFLSLQDTLGPLQPSAPVALTETQFNQSRDLYFNHCAGCHGLYRKGATGPNIGEARSQSIGTDGLGATMRYGTPGGMPNLGQSGILTRRPRSPSSVVLPATAAAGRRRRCRWPEIQASWNLIVPVAQRPTTPQTARNWENYFGVVLRDAGKIAIFDGDTKKKSCGRTSVSPCTSCVSSSGPLLLRHRPRRPGIADRPVGEHAEHRRDGEGLPRRRSVDGSKFAGYEDSYLIEGCYWPPQYVVYRRPDIGAAGPQRPAHEQHHRRDPARGAGGVDRRLALRTAVVDVAQGERLRRPGRLLAAGLPAGTDHRRRAIPARRRLGSHRTLLPGGGQCQQQDGGHRYRHAQSWRRASPPASSRIRAAAPTGSIRSTAGSMPRRIIGETKVSIYGADPAGRPDDAWTVVREITLPVGPDRCSSRRIRTRPGCCST